MQRISQSMMSSLFLDDMHSSLSRLMDVEKQMSSQQLYSKPSDNPAEVARGMTVNTTISRNEQYQRNLEDAVTWLSNTDIALGQVTDLISSIREKTIYAGDGSLSQVDREALAEDIRAMRDELMQTANFNVEGRFLLGGLQTSEAPYYKDESGNIMYRGDENRISFELEEGTTGSVSINGRDVFPTSFTRRCVTSIEVPVGFKWEGTSEILQISVGDDSAQVLIPQRWDDMDILSTSDLTDHDGFQSPDEDIRGYSLSEIAELINSSQGAAKLVHASVETDSLSGTESLSIQSLSGEPLQVASLPWTDIQERGQYVSSSAAAWPAGTAGEIYISMGEDVSYQVSINAGDSAEDVAYSISALDGLWAGARGDGSITVVAEDSSDTFSVSASGSGTALFPTNTTSEAVEVPKEISHIGLSAYLGMSTAVTSAETATSLGDTTVNPLDMVFISGSNRMELSIGEDSDLTLQELAERIKASAGDWLEVIVQEDETRENMTDPSADDLEGSTARLMLIPKDGSSLTIYDVQNDWAKNMGIQTALSSTDLSATSFPGIAGPDIPVKIGVEIGGSMYEVKFYEGDVTDSSGNIDPRALGLKIREQAGSDKIGFGLTEGDTGLALYSLTGEPVRVVDLPYSDPALNYTTSGFAMNTGLQSGITSGSVATSATPSSDGSLIISSGSREISVSVATTDTLETLSSKIKDMAGSWLDVSLADDGSGNYRMALSPKDGSAVNVYDVNGSAAIDFGLNTDLRVQAGAWTGGDTFSVEVDGYTHRMDLEGLTSLEEVASLINVRFSEGDVEARVVENGGTQELVLYSPVGKDIAITPPAGMNLPSGSTTPERGANGSTGPNNQNLAVRSGANVEESDLFALLEDLAVAVEQGADEALSESFLPRLDEAIDEALRARSYCGALQRRYETAESRLSEDNIAYTDLYSSIMDVDMAEAAIEFQTAQTVYQATLATIAKVVQPTLVDYLS